MMVAIPLTPVIERDDEEVASFQVFKHCLRVTFPRECIAERGAEPVENRGSNKEAPDVFRLGLQYLVDEIVGDVAIVAGEGIDESANVGARLHGKCGQLEPG